MMENTFFPDSKFSFAVIGLAHGHIYSMCAGLIRAGAVLRYVYEEDPALLDAFVKKYPEVTVCPTEETLLAQNDIQLVASAAIPSQRAPIAVRSMRAGKHVVVDKAPLISFEQLDAVKKAVAETGQKYFVYYSESIDEPSTIYALELVKQGIIGKLLHFYGTAPHLLNPKSRPDWFFRREDTGGILTDIGSHQVHQFLRFAGCKNADVVYSRIRTRQYGEGRCLDEEGEFLLEAENGVTGTFYLNWKTPDGLKTWGDVRMILQGEDGFIEVRKNLDLAHDLTPCHVLVVTQKETRHEIVSDSVSRDYFPQLISDCTQGTAYIDPETDFTSIEIAMRAQEMALNQKR